MTAETGAGERKVATIVFADLVGSTELGAAHDPEGTRALLDRFYDAMAAEVERAGGTIEKFAGDAVMAAFGVPAALEDHAERALHAALAMRRRTRELDDRLELRIGVNTGEVVSGRAREGSSFVTGDPVNVAARLEQGAEPGEILVGERTVGSAGGAFEFEGERTIEAKGKPGGVACRRLARALSLMRPRGVRELGSAFVGRDRELDRLLAGYRRTVERAGPELVTILGDAGVGKTRLVRELWERLPGESVPPLRRTGRCLSYGRGITYWPLAEVLKEHFGILESDTAKAMIERLGDDRFLALTFGLDVAEGMHPLLVRDRFQDAWTAFLTGLSAERPLVMLVEDLHWAEEQLLDLLERLAADVDGPLLLIATARPELQETRPGWGRAGKLLELEALSAEESARMLEQLLGGALPGRLREVVVERAEGNPFFVEELLGTLVDRGLLRRNGNWSLAELPSGFSIPDSVQALLAARIDLLDPPEKEALQAAAVIGRVFWPGAVYELVGGEPDLRVLEERDFIRRRSGSTLAGEREYAIKHSLTREVAYDGLPKARRARLHAAFAGWLERTDGARDELAPLLAHHYAEAVRPEDADLAWAGAEAEAAELRRRAVTWLQGAGELASSRYELDDAIALFRRALELEAEPSEQARLWHALGRAYALAYDERFVEPIETAIALTTDPEAKAEMYADLALDSTARGGMWSTLPADEVIDRWIELALEHASTASATRAKALLARLFWRWDEEASSPDEAAEIAEWLDDPDLRAYAMIASSRVSFAHGEYEESLACGERIKNLSDQLTDPDLIADGHAAAIPAAAVLGRFGEAERLANVQRAINEKLTPHHRVHGVAIQCEVAELRGDWQTLIGFQPEVVERVEANLDTPCVRNGRTLLLCGLAQEHAGDKGVSRELEQRAMELWMEGHGLVFEGALLQLALARGDLAEVERLCDSASSWRWRTPVWFYMTGITALMEGLATLRRLDELEEAVDRFSRPGTVFEAFGLKALGVAREERALLEQAVHSFEALALNWHAEETRRLLAEW